jgi:hypothetical protein
MTMYEDDRDVRNANFSADDPAVISGGEGYVDYFGFGEDHIFVMPDGKQTIEFRVMNEGERAKFQRKTSKDIKFNRASGDAAIKADQAEERWELIMTSVTGWSFMQRGPQGWVPVPFSGGSPSSALGKWLTKADPKIVDDLELAIRRANPWMQADMTVEEIDKEIDRLTDLRKEVEERERGK